jgi:peptide/nickel transport system substrate-binding protein
MRFALLARAGLVAAVTLTTPIALAAPSEARLTIGLSQEPDTLHPVISTMDVSRIVRNTVLHPLGALNEQWKLECWLCVEIPTLDNGLAKIVPDASGKAKLDVTWEIRPDATWGDGAPVTGEDVKLAWQVGTSPNVTNPSAAAFEGVESVTVDAKNPRRVTMRFKEPRYDFNELDLAFAPIASHIDGPIWERTKNTPQAYEKQSAYVTDPTNPGLYDAGYRVAEIKPGSHVLVVRNEKFYGKPAPIKSLLFKFIDNTQALEANLVSGNIDMIGGVGASFDQALAFEKRLKGDASLAKLYKVTFLDDLIYEHLDFNLEDPRVSEADVRRALTLAVDRTAMCKALFDLRQKPALHSFHPMAAYYTEDVAKYPYDVAKAEALLDAAGWKKGEGGVRAKNGVPLALQIGSTSANKSRELVEVYLQEAWRKIGVKLTIKNEPARTFFGETLPKRRYGQLAMYASTWGSGNDIQNASFESSQIPTAANGWAGSNYMGWKNAKVDAALTRAKAELDAAKRKTLMTDVVKEVAAELPQMPLYYRAAIQIVPTSLRVHQSGGMEYPVSLRAHLWEVAPAAH